MVVTGFKAYRLDCRIPFVRGLHLDLQHLIKLVKLKKYLLLIAPYILLIIDAYDLKI